MPRASRVDLFARTADTIATFHRLGDELGSRLVDDQPADTERIPFRKPNFSFPSPLPFFLFPPFFLHSADQLSRQSTVSSPLVPVLVLVSTNPPSLSKVKRNRKLDGRKCTSTGCAFEYPSSRSVPGIGNDLNIPWNEPFSISFSSSSSSNRSIETLSPWK